MTGRRKKQKSNSLIVLSIEYREADGEALPILSLYVAEYSLSRLFLPEFWHGLTTFADPALNAFVTQHDFWSGSREVMR